MCVDKMYRLLPLLALLASASAQSMGDLDTIIAQLKVTAAPVANKNDDLNLSPVTPAGKDLDSIIAQLKPVAQAISVDLASIITRLQSIAAPVANKNDDLDQSRVTPAGKDLESVIAQLKPTAALAGNKNVDLDRSPVAQAIGGDLDSIIARLQSTAALVASKNDDSDWSRVTPAGKDLESVIAQLKPTAALAGNKNVDLDRSPVTQAISGDLDSIIARLQSTTAPVANKNDNLDLSPVTAAGKDLESVIAQLKPTAALAGNKNVDLDRSPVTQAISGNLDSIIARLQSTAAPVANKNDDLDLSPVTPTADDKSCTTDDNEEGECVPFYLCDENHTIIEDGTGLINIRSVNDIIAAPIRRRRRVRDSICPEYFQNCCVFKERRKPTNPITPPPPANAREGCGWHNPDGVGTRITGGVDGEANFAEFPWMVAILMIEPVDAAEPDGKKLNVYVGGGSLIHPSVVLTAAYCAATAGTMRVRAGEWDTQTKNELYPYQERDVRQAVVHKDYNSGNLFYDIGLLFLSTPVDPAPNVGVVCLPPLNMRVDAGTRCLASGWGKDVFGKEGRYQVILKRVEVPVVEHARCEQLLQSTRLSAHFRLHSSFMCAGGEPGRDTCRGDGGSPLVCPAQYDTDRYVQYGIVAWGIGCGNETPGVYVDVAKLRSWIDDKVRGQGFDPSVYTIV